MKKKNKPLAELGFLELLSMTDAELENYCSTLSGDDLEKLQRYIDGCSDELAD
jgi:hypothetical protein